MEKSRVIIRSVKDRKLDDVVEEILEFCNWRDIVSKDSKVVVKPNLCAADKKVMPAANVSPELVASVCRIISTKSKNVFIGESDGMRHKAEEALENSGMYKIADELGIKTINFSKDELVPVDVGILEGWRMSKTLLEADVVVTLPTLKTHASFVFTGAMKNQWGCIPRYDRCLLHHHFDRVVNDINRLLNLQIAVMDGIMDMEGRGPAMGNPVRMDLLLASNDVVAIDAAAMRLIGLDPYSASYIALAEEEGLGRVAQDRISIDGDFERFKTVFKPGEYDWALKTMSLVNRSYFLTHYLAMVDTIFYPIRKAVIMMRKIVAVVKNLRMLRPSW